MCIKVALDISLWFTSNMPAINGSRAFKGMTRYQGRAVNEEVFIFALLYFGILKPPLTALSTKART